MAMRGMEDEDKPEYTLADLKEQFSWHVLVKLFYFDSRKPIFNKASFVRPSSLASCLVHLMIG